MPQFEYKAVAPTGETVQGMMDAASVEGVIAKLQEGGSIPLQAREAGSGGFSLDALRFRRRGMNAREVGEFTQQLATLLGAGLPLDRSLQVLVELAESERVRRTAADVRDRVREGGSLSGALEAQHGTFTRLYVNMVRAGEVGGTLDTTLARLAEYLERSKELRDSVVSASIYPMLLLVMAGLSIAVLLIVVLPQFMPLFTELGGDLPLTMRGLLVIGNGLQDWWWLLLLLIVGGVWWFRRALREPAQRARLDARLLKLKWVGDLVAKLETARFARTVGTLLGNGVPLLNALSIAKNVIGNSVLAEDVRAAAAKVKTGGGLSKNLAQSEYFPRLAIQMISVGEESGQLDTMLMKVADTYDKEVRNAIDRLLAAFTPIVTVLMAVLVGVIVYSLLQAVMSASDLFA